MPCLDTTVFIDLSGRGTRRHRAAATALLGTLSGALCTTRINVAELLVGVELANEPVDERRRVDEALYGIHLLDFDEPAAQQFAKVVAHLRRQGSPIGDLDAVIAAIALVNNEPVVTRNPRHFSKVPGLVVLSY